MRFLSGSHFDPPDGFFEHIPWFTNVEEMTLIGYGGWETLSQILSFGRLPQSVTSLTINAGAINVLQIRDILVGLPNLNDLSLSGSLIMASRGVLRGIGTVLRGNFGGRLRLLKRLATTDIMSMLLEVPTGLHFTEVEVRGANECLVPTVRLAEACGRSLVKLAYSVDSFYGQEETSQSFDFSKFPNLREVSLRLRWIHGGPRWVPAALSTVNPITSPRLSVLLLDLVGPPSGTRILESSIEGLATDLRRTRDEVTRIRSVFEEGIDLTVSLDQWFGVLFVSLQLRV